jgi:hydroxyethylthiazole kinase-like uncharacterized protein yjeF
VRMPFWLEPVYDASGMALADRWAIEEAGIASLTLMEAAGEALARETEAIAGPGPVKVVCGKGNNGGDGFVAARHLAEWGHRVEILCIFGTDDLSEDARVNFDRLQGVPVLRGADAIAAISGEATFIDAMLGTGFSGDPREPVKAAIEALATVSGPIVACDLPTGVDGSTGEASLAVAADLTVTFHGLKVGHLINPGKHLCGPVRVADIGIPAEAPAGSAAGVIEPEVVGLLPLRGVSSTKFSSGRVSVVGGSRGLTGAVCLASEAAARAGAGYVTAAVPASLESIFEAKLTEVMTVGLADDGSGRLSESALEEVLAHSNGAGAVVIGSGIGRSPQVALLVAGAIQAIDVPIVVDADALSVLGPELEWLTGRQAPTVMTPHPGEMARLLGVDSSTVQARRLHCAEELAASTGATVVLKGDDTIVRSGERTAINDLASPALATAGTGDVLAGVIAAFLARGVEPFEAASAGVIAHSRAGRIAARNAGLTEGVIASDVIDALPAAVAGLADSGRGVE